MIVAAALNACGSPYYTSDPIEAWVVDAETGQPIEGAVVTANWQLVSPGLDTGGRKLRQLEVMETVTDKNGRFYFPGFTKLNLSFDELREENPQILIFKSGYMYLRWVSSDSARASSSPQRSSMINGKRLALRKANSDAAKYAFDLGFLTTSLMNIWISGASNRIPLMTRALTCENRRLVAIDKRAGISVPGAQTEVDCEPK